MIIRNHYLSVLLLAIAVAASLLISSAGAADTDGDGLLDLFERLRPDWAGVQAQQVHAWLNDAQVVVWVAELDGLTVGGGGVRRGVPPRLLRPRASASNLPVERLRP